MAQMHTKPAVLVCSRNPTFTRTIELTLSNSPWRYVSLNPEETSLHETNPEEIVAVIIDDTLDFWTVQEFLVRTSAWLLVVPYLACSNSNKKWAKEIESAVEMVVPSWRWLWGLNEVLNGIH